MFHFPFFRFSMSKFQSIQYEFTILIDDGTRKFCDFEFIYSECILQNKVCINKSRRLNRVLIYIFIYSDVLSILFVCSLVKLMLSLAFGIISIFENSN